MLFVRQAVLLLAMGAVSQALHMGAERDRQANEERYGASYVSTLIIAEMYL